ncbi:DNA-directed RNA polymerase subunit alpha [Porphyromonas crevioricanis]|uniref:DNA-directed RNA polymerase subunit alpha n=2 Tax=Porphyromonas crevioricanis TaxID=393921 RepID=A0A0A2FGK7_9PORP|nr:DNA-directed RNA polymerase subunit alpha [Porphyromonas crevioricanis]KGN90128.1 DNA-directed RNA polymerase subunit alpha [Porphyromonas crevioricanis]SJZ80977.1 DNA-directed RNA polymerase subunit alpha [Porphyromonas crevioricanis]SQH72523.1 DNA-directed RNA polymerase subunit alpha [Porphyromonas crevioricanis]GAD04983.1 DNA-directed RNA polymerase alpha subunit [Porphyromonas crevioricanis JCM 15906]GAD08537.1 DNA-directed RNA polymerase alpha subunit [Porphyromonas crevioricanis JCM 
MAILAFQKPDSVLMMEASDSFAKFEFRPLEPGYGITIGNALRRILLSSLEGFAITSIKIEGVDHEFATIPGVLEDVTNIILKLKQVRFKQLQPDVSEETIRLQIEKKVVFKAGDMNEQLTGFTVLNPSLEVCHLDPSASMQIELTIKKGRGYQSADENRSDSDEIHTIAIDSIYTPIRNVKCVVENFRVEQKTDFEKLLLEVSTDGSIHPREALSQAAGILIEHFALFAENNFSVVEEAQVSEEAVELSEEDMEMQEILNRPLTEFDLSVRALNCLRAADVDTMGDLVKCTKADLLKVRNFGRKSLTELEELFEKCNLSFGMDVSKYKLDKE